MASRFQAAALVAAPSYPKAIAWSEENLIAVASGHLVTIINPAMPSGPRGLITIRSSEPYPIGRVREEDLLSDILLPTALSRDRRPCVRSISWSPIGLASNAGCLLAVCTVEGHVKLYRSPFCDFCAEWIEVVDISDMFFHHQLRTNFGELETVFPHISDELAEKQGCANVFLKSCLGNERTRRLVDANRDICNDLQTLDDHLSGPRNGTEGEKRSPVKLGTKSGKRKKHSLDNCTLSLITGEQYASRSALLSQIVVAWSPVLCLSSENSIPESDLCNRFSLLAVGGKSGKISIWKVIGPKYYSTENSSVPTCVKLVQLFEAHSSWVTTISFAVLGSKSKPQVILASGSSDGSAKIWLWNSKDLELSDVNGVVFSLMKEVLYVNPVPVSVLSITVKAPYLAVLALGKGSGFFEVWTCDIAGCALNEVGSYEAHDYVVTDLAWAFDGCCLYSCGQDNYIRGWIVQGSVLCEIPIPSNTLGLRSSTELPDGFLSCQGVALSPGNLVLAVARNLDVDQLNPMYQASTQRAVVEFFWIGGQKLDISPINSLNTAKELVNWESNILWSLKKHNDMDKPLVLWDSIAALSAFRESMPAYMENLLVKWLTITFLGSHMDDPINEVVTCICDSLSKVPTRTLHLLNVICRCAILSEFKAEEINYKVNLEGLICVKGEKFMLWIELLSSSERELRERLVGLNFSAFLSRMSYSPQTSSAPGYWYPVGVMQMERWVSLSNGHIRIHIKELAAEVGQHKRLLGHELGEEQCSYCSASVAFDSPEVAFCQGSENVNGVVQKHKLARCAASMQACPTTPVWFCRCCHRMVSNLAPSTLFTMPSFPEDFRLLTDSWLEEVIIPLCPFCGILLQRLQPEFLPSVSPV